ncbi:MAG: hypothetical protein K0R26_1970 [Bacteroidota bacterium]|jgi:hypothetical protein|nr:hypothetical protein [Bacteroidota bacterium]
MKANVEIWTVQDLFDNIENINKQPKYQRGAVWKDAKRSLLIDSMLRGIDLPKFYLHKKSRGAFTYEVADGQQRMDAIIKFKKDKLPLREDSVWGLDLNLINGAKLGGSTYSQLRKNYQEKFDNYHVTVAIIEEASNSEIRTLFGRLQLGETLKPAEKRNSLISIVGDHIDLMALTHDFFSQSKIKDERYNRQDYLAHIFALICYQNTSDLKAELLQKLYLNDEFKWTQKTIKCIVDVLNIMKEIDQSSKKRIINKFSFIDIFWFLYKKYDGYSSVDVDQFASKYDELETNRLVNYKSSDALLRTGKAADKDLYEYIMAYRYEGARTSSIEKRNVIFGKKFSKYLLA